MSELSGGIMTFLLSDIEGSTRMWEQHPREMDAAVARHDALAAELVAAHRGTLVKNQGEGDSLFVVFVSAVDAVAGACALSRALASEPWPTPTPLRVRMALHAGEATFRDGDYYGQAVNRCARLRAAAHGGQVLLSGAVEEVVRDNLPAPARLNDLGTHRLRDLSRPERVFQLVPGPEANEFPPIRSLESHPNNLPEQLTSFIGRANDLSLTRELLDQTRLLTLTGAGGTGKTRLSLELAAGALEDYQHGVWMIELAALSDPALVPKAVAGVLAVPEQPGVPVVAGLVERLRSSRVLLVFDNCEHVLGTVASLVEALLRSCPGVKVLASSREGLNLPGEVMYRVPSMSLPEADDPREPDHLLQYEAVRLFLERARQYQPRFEVTPENASAVAQICRRLDGIPLALELAAARLRALSVREIAARLDDRFRLLTGGSRTALPRQQTLRALIDWSHDLLTPPERVLLRRLAVFRGGWTLEAAERVCSGEPLAEGEVLDLLTHLVDKSLVSSGEQMGLTRYSLLETVRQYAGDRLMESGEGALLRTRAAEFFVELAEREHPLQVGPQQRESVDRIEADHDNLRAAAEWLASDEEFVPTHLRLTAAMLRFWVVRGHYGEGRAHSARALAQPRADRHPHLRSRVLVGAGLLSDNLGDHSAARAYYEEAVPLCREVGDGSLTARALMNLAVVAGRQGNHEEERRLQEEALPLVREAGDRPLTGWLLSNLSAAALRAGDPQQALTYATESLAIQREQEFAHGIGFALHQFCDALLALGDPAGARRAAEESLGLFRHMGHEHGIASTLVRLAVLAEREGDLPTASRLRLESLERYHRLGQRSGVEEQIRALAHLALARESVEAARAAAGFYGSAEAMREVTGGALEPEDAAELAADRALLVELLSPEECDLRWAAGLHLTLEAALKEVRMYFAGAHG